MFHQCLMGVPIFRELEENDLIAISDLIRPVHLDKEEALYQKGVESHALYVLHEGSLKLYDINENGDETMIRMLLPGDFIGESSLFEAQKTNHFVSAIEKSHVCMIQGESLIHLIKKTPLLSIKIIQALSKNLREADNKVLNNQSLSSKDRVKMRLNQMADKDGLITLKISKKEFANSLSMAKETLSRQLKQLEQEKVILMQGQRKIQLLNYIPSDLSD